MHPSVGWLVAGPGWEAWRGVACLWVNQVYHVSAVAAEGLIFFFFARMPREQNCFGREGRRVLPGFGLQALKVLKQVGG